MQNIGVHLTQFLHRVNKGDGIGESCQQIILRMGIVRSAVNNLC
jgi:hypothetical protein